MQRKRRIRDTLMAIMPKPVVAAAMAGRDKTVNPVEPPIGSATKKARPEESPRRILVVDDNQDIADCLSTLMQRRGFDVRVAYDGSTAVELAVADKPSVVLLDIGLPGLDGYEVCRQMRQRGLTDTRIIAVTGYGMDRDRKRSKEAGFDVHAVKPVRLDTLLELIA